MSSVKTKKMNIMMRFKKWKNNCKPLQHRRETLYTYSTSYDLKPFTMKREKDYLQPMPTFSLPIMHLSIQHMMIKMIQIVGEIFKEVFPDKEIIPINCLKLIEQGGSLHCSTMQVVY